MNTISAVFIAIAAGIAAALYAYGLKESVKSLKGLALLRFLWTVLLVYALFSRPALTQSYLEVKSPLTVLVDSSRSVKVDLKEPLSKLEKVLRSSGVPFIIKDFDKNTIPNQSDWIYLGDGHITGPEVSSKAPLAALMAPAKDMLPLPLISGVSAPLKVMENGLISGRVLADQDVEVIVRSGKQKSRGHDFDLKALNQAGNQKIEVIATRGDQIDTSIFIVEVVKNFSTWLIISERPHPVEGMIRRFARKKGIEVITMKPDEFQESSNAPAVIISSGSSLDEKVQALCAGPYWRVSSTAPIDSKIRKLFTIGDLPTGTSQMRARLRVEQEKADIKIGSRSIESRGIDWYASALESKESFDLFENLCQSLELWNTPLRIEVSLPQRIFTNQSYSVAAALIGADNKPLTSSMKVELSREGELINRPKLQRKGQGFEFRNTWRTPGYYQLKFEANYGSQSTTSSRTFEVLPLDIERIQPFNHVLWRSWSKMQGTQIFDVNQRWDQVGLDFPSKQIVVQQKNPQHNYWWYWGLCMVLAAYEWLLRRRKGMV